MAKEFEVKVRLDEHYKWGGLSGEICPFSGEIKTVRASYVGKDGRTGAILNCVCGATGLRGTLYKSNWDKLIKALGI